jgi:hypothetical protein
MEIKSLLVGVGLFGMFGYCQLPERSEAQERAPAAARPAAPTPAATAPTGDDVPPARDVPPAGDKVPEYLKRLSPNHDVWLDTKRKAVVIDGEVCLREGQLEMFACPKGTKEHESIVSLNCLPQDVHAGLLAAGAKTGTPVKFDPKYAPATGDVIDVYVLWRDAKGEKHQVKAQEWIKHAKTEKAMEYDWVFAGSGFWTEEETGKRHYQANGGDFICVSNFPTATLDLPVESSQANSELLFHAFTENIPPKGTKVRLVLKPRAKAAGAKPAEAK